ncbi:MAG: hypothetical protein ACRDY7_13870 [Acidimicrobiia bacterium]
MEAETSEPCRLCRTAVPPEAARCPECGLYQAATFSSANRWRLVGALAALYALTAVLVALAG